MNVRAANRKVLLINGSPNQGGNTFSSLEIVRGILNREEIETEYFHIGNKPVYGCCGCRKCTNGNQNRCVFHDDVCNDLIQACIAADGIVIGSPVYFAGPNGALCALLDRVFAACSEKPHLLKGKPGAALVSFYRAGATATLDRLHKYFAFSEMPIITSSYWNLKFEAHSSMENDEKGIHTLETLGANMAKVLKNGILTGGIS